LVRKYPTVQKRERLGRDRFFFGLLEKNQEGLVANSPLAVKSCWRFEEGEADRFAFSDILKERKTGGDPFLEGAPNDRFRRAGVSILTQGVFETSILRMVGTNGTNSREGRVLAPGNPAVKEKMWLTLYPEKTEGENIVCPTIMAILDDKASWAPWKPC